MSSAEKIRVAVLRGGPSSEYEVSLKTGETVLKNLPEKYEGVDVFISREGVWHVGGFEKQPAAALKGVDVAFIALHGQYGGDGQVQRILEGLKIPFTGSRSDESALVADKHSTKQALSRLKNKIKMTAHKLYSRDEVQKKGAEQIFREIVMPAVVKPLSGGSSVDESVVKTFFDLEPALVRALEHGDAVIIEECIPGRHAVCGIIEGFRGQEIYSLIPLGDFDLTTKIKVQEAAKAIHKELGLRHYSRSDLIVSPRRGIYFSGTSALPHLAPGSPMHASLGDVGATLPQFLDHVLSLALGSTQ